jgi:hypothetical protein
MKEQIGTIDVTPTWGEIGILYVRLAESGERQAIRAMRDDVAKAFAFAEAFKAIRASLPPELRELADTAASAEVAKQRGALGASPPL